MATRYWVGGTGTWDSTTTHWAATSNGAGGASVPTSADDVIFDANSGISGAAYTVTISASITAQCKSLNMSGTGTQAVTWAGSATAYLNIYGSMTLGLLVTRSYTGTIQFFGSGGADTISTGGYTLASPITIGGGSYTLGGAITNTAGSIAVAAGSFDTAGYAVTTGGFSTNSTAAKTVSLRTSTLALSGTSSFLISNPSSLTFNAGTSQINCSSATPTFTGGGQTFYNVSFTSAAQTAGSITGANTFNNLTIGGRTTAGINAVSIAADQIINGTLTLSAGTNATMRTFLRSDAIGTTRTLTVNSFAAGSADIDFRDITIAGSAAPIGGTRFGDCKGNSGITFPTAKTVYWNLAAGGNWSGTGWAATGGGAPAVTNFPLAQDTAVFQSTGLNSTATITVNANYNIGTIDMSARTTNTMTLATGATTPAIYSNWINGTGVTLSGTGTLTFAGRGSQTITSAGKAFTQPITINSPGGSITLQDAFTYSGASSFALRGGTFDTGTYTCSVYAFDASGTNTRALSLNGVLSIFGASSTAFYTINTGSVVGLTVTGSGTIGLTATSGKTFYGGNIQTYPTLNQGGTGTLTILGSNKFANITNTAIGSVLFTGGTTNEFTAFNLNGTSTAARLTLGSTNTTQAILKKPSTWYMGAGSLDNGNNTGLNFSAGGGIDYLAVSYINGQTTGAPPTYNAFGNFFMLF